MLDGGRAPARVTWNRSPTLTLASASLSVKVTAYVSDPTLTLAGEKRLVGLPVTPLTRRFTRKNSGLHSAVIVFTEKDAAPLAIATGVNVAEGLEVMGRNGATMRK